MTRLHTLVAIVVCAVLPGSSWLDGSGSLAWTMFASRASFRLEITASRGGRRRVINPTSLAAYAVPSARSVLAGSDHFRHGEAARRLRPALPELAELACRTSGAEAVSVALEWRQRSEAPLQRAVASASCRLHRAHGRDTPAGS